MTTDKVAQKFKRCKITALVLSREEGRITYHRDSLLALTLGLTPPDFVTSWYQRGVWGMCQYDVPGFAPLC